jgi:hypothetical protein
MKTPFVIAILAASVVVGSTSCSSKPAPSPQSTGNGPHLAAGTAHITVNGNDLGEFHAVHCTSAGDLLTIVTGNDQSGATAIVSNADGLIARTVAINDLGGFTGSFNENLGGDATVTLSGATYSITGKADGFATDKPSFRANGTFSINVAC